MRVLVGGGGGFVGRPLCRRLDDGGHEVVRLVRPGTAPGEGAVAWDPDGGAIDAGALARRGPFDAVVNLSGAGIGERRWTAGRRRQILGSRLAATRLLATTAAGLDPRPSVFVSASAVGIYGDRGDEVLTEDSVPGAGFLADVCVQWEAAAAPVAAAGIRLVLLRSGVVLDRSGGALARQLTLFRLGLGAHLGSGRQFVSWITLADELAVIERALVDDALRGPVNATAPEPVTNAEFTRALGRALHRPAVLGVPRLALEAGLGRGLARELLLCGQRVLPARLGATGFVFAHPGLDGALAAVVPPH